MLRITKLTDYAVLVLSVLAAEAQAEPSRVLNVGELAERTHLEPPTVAKVLKPLAQAGLVDGFRGAGGGYRLARAASKVSLKAIVEAMEGPLGMTECAVHTGQCDLESHCQARANWRRVNDVIADALARVSLAQMLAPVPQRGAGIRLQLTPV